MEKHLLIVDDEPAIVSALKRLLRKCDFSIRTANSADEALKAMEEFPAAVILSDYQMPKVNGLQLLTAVADRWPATIRLILTGSNDSEEVFKGDVVHHVLEKPWSSSHLIETLDQVFASGKVGLSGAGAQATPANDHSDLSAISSIDLIDQQAIEQLAEDVTEQTFPELVLLFIQSTEQRLSQLENAVQQQTVHSSLVDTRRQLHTLASSMALYGLARCAKYARYYEHAPADEIEQHLAQFSKLSRESIAAFNRYVASRT